MSSRNRKDRHLAPGGGHPAVTEYSVLAAFRKGPLPPPAELERYETMYPGAAKLLFDNFIGQTNHRMELEKLVIQEDNRRANKAQRNSFFITMAILVLAGILFVLGKDGPAIAAVFTAIAPIVIAFITSSISRKKERDNKRKELGLS